MKNSSFLIIIFLFAATISFAQVSTSSSGRVNEIKTEFSFNLKDGYHNRTMIESGWTSGIGDFISLKHAGNNPEAGTYGLRISDGMGFDFGKNNFSTSFLKIKTTGNVGIGTNNPSHKLQIVGAGRTGLRIGGPRTSSGAISDLLFQPSNGGSVGGANFWDWSFRTDYWSKSPGDFVLYSHNGSNYTSPIIVQANGNLLLATGKNSARNGNVSIGTTDPVTGFKLSVAGKVITEGVKVEKQTNWPDYVFENEYQLPTLQQVEDHILQKGHLINIPSAKEVEKNGFFLEEMNAKLLEKIEELTLYIIAQEKKHKTQKAEIALQKEQNIKQQQINKDLKSRLTKIEALLEKNN